MAMKQIKVAEATELQLDWLVARIEGDELPKDGGKGLDYSTDWAHGGPIVEREFITVEAGHPWQAVTEIEVAEGDYIASAEVRTYGPTPLVAAMRCYAVSKLGDTVEVPEELV